MPANADKPLVLTQIAVRLKEIFDGHIDLSDVQNKPQDQQDQYFLTRSYSALFLLQELGLTPSEAGAAVTDGGEDDGIDIVHIDKANATIYLGQSKWRWNMQKGVELVDFTRFRDGVKAVIDLNWTNENKNLHRYKVAIEQQLQNINTDIVLYLAHTSEQEIAQNIQAKISEFLVDSNRYNEDFMTFREFTVPEAVKTARSFTRPENIDLAIMLGHWGMPPNPYKAVYGSVAASDVVGWFDEFGNRLFAENLRYGIEKSEVNEGIIATASSDPDNFWYFNNGITAICDSIAKKPIGGNDTESGVFDVKKVSIINGAQTVSSLHRAKQAGADLNKVKVHLRVVSLSDTPEGFAQQVTSANNTQNDLNPVDFVAGDQNQERIRKEAAQLNLTYTFRRGDKDPAKNLGFTVRSATIAAACASGDLKLAVSAKRYISGLWENTKKEPYTKLFGDGTTATYLWKIVRIMNAVDDQLLELSNLAAGRERLVAVHGNRFILFYVFQNIDLGEINSLDGIEDIESKAKIITIGAFAKLNVIIGEFFPESYPGNIFKNQEKQVELIGHLENLDK